MALPTASDVIALTGTALPEAVVNTIIGNAGLIAAKCLIGASDELETAALLWLAAHLVASTSSNGAVTSRRLGDASISYASASTSDGLGGTVYGQQAIALLPCLATAGRATASIEVI